MHVGVDQTGHDELARDVDDPMRPPVVRPNAGNHAVGDYDIGRLDRLCEDVDHLSADQGQIAGLQSAGDTNASLERSHTIGAGGLVGRL